MGVSIRIDEKIFEAAKMVANAECRSVPQQIEFWAKVGKCALENPDVPIEFLTELMKTKLLDRSLAEPFNFEKKSD